VSTDQRAGFDLAVASLAAAAVALGAREARGGVLRDAERRAFAALNGLSDRPRHLVWLPMQAGSLGGALAVAASVGRRDPRLGRRLAAVGAVAWVAAKAVKPVARRGRPGAVLQGRVLGRPQAGLGYPSGHAAVAVAMATAAAPALPPAWRATALVAAGAVAGARLYVGAHLPLDVLGGAALGVAVAEAAAGITGRA